MFHPTLHPDNRGCFFEAYSERELDELELHVHFVQDNQSISHKGVLRGLHSKKNFPQGKLVRAITGSFFDVAVDLRKDSPTYAKSKNTSCIMRYYEASVEKLKKCGVVTIDENDRITDMAEKPAEPKSHWCCPPFYYYTKEDAKLVKKGIEAGCGVDAPGSYIAWLCAQTPVYAMEMLGRRYDIGNLESYHKVQEEYKGIH